MHIACIVIATERRRLQLREVLASVVGQGFDDIVVVGDWTPKADDPTWGSWGVRYLCVAPLTQSTNDALVKRDIGTLATDADLLVYLCDDHALGPHFVHELRAVADEAWDVLVPNRYVYVDKVGGAAQNCKTQINNGEADGYCGGHGGVFRRDVIVTQPWSAHAHHRNWDAQISHAQRARGARFCWHPRTPLHIIDIEPNGAPWV